MRGRTLSNAFIVLDEAQNTTVAQMKMFLTRFGEGSRMVICGDPRQVDLPQPGISGLADAVARLEGVERSEEHTSELQSLMRISYAVFCLKKKKHKIMNKS